MRRLLLVVLLSVLFGVGCRAAPAGQVSPRETPPPGSVAQESATVKRGEVLYNANCLACHGGAIGGGMMDYPPRHNQYGHTWHHPDCQLTDIVLNGAGEMGEMMRRMMPVPEGTPRMPAFKGTLAEEDVRSILAFIKTWWTQEQRAAQAAVTRAQC